MNKVQFLLAALAILPFVSCKTPQDLLDDYNSRFEKVPVTAQDLFDADNPHLMLREAYKVGIESSFVLNAPLGCDSYTWKITAPKMSEAYNLAPYRTNEKTLRLYFPKINVLYDEVRKSKLKRVPYDITLTVQKSGKSYSDTAILILYTTD
ncbi:MAG: hypothetical protein ACTTHU_06285 [Treponema sp.]